MLKIPQVHFPWDFNRFLEEDGVFVEKLVDLDAGVKVGLTTMHTFDHSGRPIAKSLLRRVSGKDDDTGHLLRKDFPGKEPPKRKAGKLLWDAKLNDLSHQVAGAVAGIVKLNVFGLTVMATDNNQRTLNAAREERDRAYQRLIENFDTKHGEKILPERPVLFGVTHLSSSERGDFEDAVLRRAEFVAEAGFDGIIVPGNLLRKIRNHFPDLITYVIAIRPEWSKEYIPDDDQRRPISHLEASALGAHHICIGRPIWKNPSPLGAIKRVQNELNLETVS